MRTREVRRRERGTILVTVILFIAIAIAALAAISSSRVVSESEHQKALEQESRAYNDAYAQLQLALNVVNTSAYTDENRNIELRDAIGGLYGGTAAGEPDSAEAWLKDPTGVLHGKIQGTDVSVYHGRDYIKRLQKLKGQDITDVDPTGESDSFYVIESLGRSGPMTRLVSALIRENEPFSSFVFFQNRHPLGVSGSPRGLIHSNENIEFYFPNGNYVDSVSAAGGFDYMAGATTANTNIRNGNPEATQINLEAVNFAELKTQANLFTGTAGLDARIVFNADGTVRIRQYTPPHYEQVEHSWTGDVLVGYETVLVTQTQQVQVGTVQEARTRQVVAYYDTETYFVDVPVYETQTVTRTREDPVYETQQVARTRQVPIYELQDATCTRWVQVFVPYSGDPGGGTAVGGDGGVPGEYVWQQEQYTCQQNVLVGYNTETYYENVQVQVGTTTVTWQENVQVQVGTVQEERTRQVPVYTTETYYVDVPVYESQDVQVEQQQPVYQTQTYTWTTTEFVYPQFVDETIVNLIDNPGTIYIDGRVTELYGDVRGRVTLVGNDKIRLSGDLKYVDAEGDTAMLNGNDYTKPYERNEAYNGDSVLGIIARDDLIFTEEMPTQAEINATLMSATGRVGIDGFTIDDATGEPVADPFYGLTGDALLKEQAYDQAGGVNDPDRFVKASLRRLGGIISNDRILETYIKPRGDGTSYVASGFKRGTMRFDFNLMFNPPPNFVEVPRPVVTSIAPVYFVRGQDE